MNSFAPASAFFGGLLIGTSAALLLLVNGRIAGISGIVDGLLSPRLGDLDWRLAFIAGLVVAPVFYAGLGGVLPTVPIAATPTILTLGGLLIGFGARLGSGCTSGHGVCGVSRGSPRSLTATGLFVSVAILTVYVTRHLVGG
jgi:uncharacterized membrane protein YedE/YeeE